MTKDTLIDAGKRLMDREGWLGFVLIAGVVIIGFLLYESNEQTKLLYNRNQGLIERLVNVQEIALKQNWEHSEAMKGMKSAVQGMEKTIETLAKRDEEDMRMAMQALKLTADASLDASKNAVLVSKELAEFRKIAEKEMAARSEEMRKRTEELLNCNQ